MAKYFIRAGTIGGFLSIVLGSFAAHGLKQHLTPAMMATFKTAVEYQLSHSLVLILIALAITIKPTEPHFAKAGWSILAGILFFCGSLYGYALSDIHAVAFLAPIGGFAFLIGWGYLISAAWKSF